MLLGEILARVKNNLTLTSNDDGFENYINSQNSLPMLHLLSCVDKNSSRRAIQDQLPELIHSASTDNMTIQLSLIDLSKNTACLKCYNEDFSSLESDEDIVKRLKSLTKEEVTKTAKEKNVDPEKLLRFLSMPDCGLVTGSELRKFSNQTNRIPEFSVSFVSAMSGILLAAEVCKSAIGKKEPSKYATRFNAAPLTDLYMNFWYNSSYLAVTKPRSECWCNLGNPSPRSIYSRIWQRK